MAQCNNYQSIGLRFVCTCTQTFVLSAILFCVLLLCMNTQAPRRFPDLHAILRWIHPCGFSTSGKTRVLDAKETKRRINSFWKRDWGRSFNHHFGKQENSNRGRTLRTSTKCTDLENFCAVGFIYLTIELNTTLCHVLVSLKHFSDNVHYSSVHFSLFTLSHNTYTV